MDRLACVDVPALPLQLLLARHPDWKGQPTAVVDRDKPQGLIEWVNLPARQAGVLSGQRYAAALSLCPELRAGEVPQSEIDTCVQSATERLRNYSPGIEPCPHEPGVFWLDASGLHLLYPSLPEWAEQIRGALARSGLASAVAVGFGRFGTYAAAKARPPNGVLMFRSPEEERAAMNNVSLDRVGLLPATYATLEKLRIRNVGELLALPSDGILRRFGKEAHRLHCLASGAAWAPLQPLAAEEPVERTLELDEGESDFERLSFLIKRELDSILVQLAARGEALVELKLLLTLEKGSRQPAPLVPPALEETIRPAGPTLDAVQVIGLVRLRLEALRLPSGVLRIVTRAAGIPATTEQLLMFNPRPRRDLEAAGRALARIRAALGDQSVVRATLREGHLPEARFSWEPIDRVVLPFAGEAVIHPVLKPPTTVNTGAAARPLRPLIRRLEERPIALPLRDAREPDGWLLAGFHHGPVERLVGPQLISGGWWQSQAPGQSQIDRDYYFAELRSGALYWIYYDRKRRRWFRHGQVL